MEKGGRIRFAFSRLIRIAAVFTGIWLCGYCPLSTIGQWCKLCWFDISVNVGTTSTGTSRDLRTERRCLIHCTHPLVNSPTQTLLTSPPPPPPTPTPPPPPPTSQQ